MITFTPEFPPSPSSGPCSWGVFGGRCPFSSWSIRGPWQKEYPSCLLLSNSTFDFFVVFELPEQEKDKDFELIESFLVPQKFLNWVIHCSTESLLHFFISNTFLDHSLPTFIPQYLFSAAQLSSLHFPLKKKQTKLAPQGPPSLLEPSPLLRESASELLELQSLR